MRGRRSIFCVCGCSAIPTIFVEKTILSPLNWLQSFVKDQLTILVLVYIGFSILFHWFIYFSLISYCFDYSSFIVSFEIGWGQYCFFLFNIVLAIVGLSTFHKNFRVRLLISTEKLVGFYWNCIGNWHLNTIGSSYQWTWSISIYLVLQWFLYIRVLQVFSYRYCIYFGIFLPISPFWCCYEWCFLISNADCSKAIVFCMLYLYPATLL